jgi:hypothetical protein
MNACPHCGTENPDGAEFCSQCGTRLGAAPPLAAISPAGVSGSPAGGSGSSAAGAVLAPLASGCVGVAGGIFVGFALALGAVTLAGNKTHATGMLFQAVVLIAGILALVWVIRAARAPASPLHAPVLFAFLVGGLVTMLGAFSLCSGIFLENPSLWGGTPVPQFTTSPPIRSHLKGPAGQTH